MKKIFINLSGEFTATNRDDGCDLNGSINVRSNGLSPREEALINNKIAKIIYDFFETKEIYND